MRRKNGSTIGTIITLIILFSILSDVMPVLIFGVALPFILLFAGIAIIAAVLKKNGYTEVKRDNKPTKNPYSVNYNKDAADKAEQRASAVSEGAQHRDGDVVE